MSDKVLNAPPRNISITPDKLKNTGIPSINNEINTNNAIENQSPDETAATVPNTYISRTPNKVIFPFNESDVNAELPP
ncbi:MAG TPA: hypothetical protein VKR83_13565, partial [Ktedonobacteraceae bacterium]|nr:hypothetical protein [Ktedonobacteraceae bacterium]